MTLLILMLLAMASPGPWRADSYTHVTASGRWGPLGRGPLIFNASFDWNVTTHDVVNGTVSCQTTPALGTCSAHWTRKAPFVVGFQFQQGDPIVIWAQDFYAAHGQKTLFDVAGTYPGVELDRKDAGDITLLTEVRVTSIRAPSRLQRK